MSRLMVCKQHVPLIYLTGSNIPIIKEAEDCEVRKASLELGLWISMGYWTQSISLLSTDAGRASFISAFTVIVVPLLAGLSGRDIPKVTWASSLMAFVGVGLLETSGSPATLGDLWSLLSAVLFGVHMLRTEHYSRAMPSRMLLPMLGVQLGVQAAWENMWHFPWLPLIYTGTISTAFCLWIELTSMRDISATDTEVIYSLEPLWGAAFACFHRRRQMKLKADDDESRRRQQE
ncbi:hypothetical protein L7F22_022143 [Adiantum nelumboides]|nr:hypothetical protein [Adiantum nelumboides]